MKAENLLLLFIGLIFLKKTKSVSMNGFTNDNTEYLLNTLHKDLIAKTTGHGTIYVNFKGKKIRISDHEPNFNAPNRSSDLNIYYKNAEGKRILNKYEIINKVADFFNLPVPPAIKAAETKFYNQELKRFELAQKIQQEENERRKIEAKETELKQNIVKNIISQNPSYFKNIAQKAVEYGDLGANGSKRNKRRHSFIRQFFKENYNVEADFNDVSHLI